MQRAVVSDGRRPEPAPLLNGAGGDQLSGVPSRSIEAVLRDASLLTAEAEARARLAAAESGEQMVVVLSRLGIVAESRICACLADATGLPQLAPEAFPVAAVADHGLSAPFLRANHVLPVSLDPAGATVAIADPFNEFAHQALATVFGCPTRLVLARASDIDAAIDRLYGPAARDSDEGDGDMADDADVERLKDIVSDAPVIRAVNRLIAQASDARASDIHIEPTEDRLAIRFRVDGVLVEEPALPASLRGPLVSRIKILAGLNVAERRLPQDGRMRVAVRGHDIDLRVATAPAIHGESVVLRILDRSHLPLDLAALGFDPGIAAQIRAATARPHGIVLVTGPTGSGKTTTLYAALAELNTPGRKLLTVEDPIEYRLPGVTQTQVNPQIGLTFDTALRSFLRLDPDVMMVGEIRDGETAAIAVQAALTGHMILATLHTNSAAGAVTRLIDMGIEPFLLGSVLNGILAQRLVRRLCRDCRETYVPDPALWTHGGFGGEPPASLWRAVGCKACHGTGYAGRTALNEFLAVNDDIARLILRGAPTPEIADAASREGMRSLRDHGLTQVRAGVTTLEEVLRATVAD